MGPFAFVPVLALMAQAAVLDRSPLREGCGPDEHIVGYISRGDRVVIQFAVAGEGGTCYKVSVGGSGQSGYVSAAAVLGVEEFESARRGAPGVVLEAREEIVRTGVKAAGQPGAAAALLLEQNKPAEALETLEKALRSGGRDPGLLSLAGYAAYRSDDMARAMDYWKESQAIRPSPAVERLYQLAAREAREDKSSEKLVGARFLLRYNRGQVEAAAARDLVALLDQEFARISTELGCEAADRIVAIVQTPEEYRRTTDAAEWSAGQYNGRIRVASPDRGGIGESTRRTFSHEIVHACMAGMGTFPVWLHEGLAQRLSGETLTPSALESVKRLARAGQLPKLDNLSQTWSRLSASHAAVAYNTALAATELFYQQYSAIGPRSLLRNSQLLPQIAAELDRQLRQ